MAKQLSTGVRGRALSSVRAETQTILTTIHKEDDQIHQNERQIPKIDDQYVIDALRKELSGDSGQISKQYRSKGTLCL